MRNPIIIILALCACVVFPPLAFVVVPLFVLAVRNEKVRLQTQATRTYNAQAAKSRAKGLSYFASA
jgi:hypothetical protein